MTRVASFDPSFRCDQIGEAARQMILSAAIEAGTVSSVQNADEVPFLLGGLMVGIVQIMQSATGQSDEIDAAIRASIMQVAPWAVDMAREIEGRPPLHTA